MNIALLTCNEIDPNACNDDELIIPLLANEGINATFEVWNDESVDWIKYQAIIIRSTWDYTEKIEGFLNFLKEREAHLRVFNSREVVISNYDKSYIKDLEKNFQIVPTLIHKLNEKEVNNSFEYFKTQKLVLKPTIGAGASGLQVITKDKITDLVMNNGDHLVQPFLNSIETSGEVSLIFFNKNFSHAILKVPKKGDFRSQEEFGSKITSFEPDQETLNYAKEILESFSSELLFSRVDLLKNSEGLWRLIGEIELIEPALYLSFHKDAPWNFSKEITNILNK